MEISKNIKVNVVLGQNFGQVRSNVVKKIKKHALSIGFSYFMWEITFKGKKVVVVQKHEWKFKVNIARNTTLDGC